MVAEILSPSLKKKNLIHLWFQGLIEPFVIFHITHPIVTLPLFCFVTAGI